MDHVSVAGIRPIILCGNLHRRLWSPDSPFLSTLQLVSDRTRYAAPVIVGHIEHTFLILADLHRLGIRDAIIFLEPDYRSTATSAIIAALSEHLEDMLHLVLPVGHTPQQEANFHRAVSDAANTVRTTNIALFGMPAASTDLGHGYIIPGEPLQDRPLCRVGVFTEQADATFARVLVSQGGLRNSGMALYDPRLLCEEAAIIAPVHYAQCQKALNNAQHERKCVLLRSEDYADMKSHGLGELVFQHTQHCLVLPCDFEWLRAALSEMPTERTERRSSLRHSTTVRDSYILAEGAHITAFGMETAS